MNNRKSQNSILFLTTLGVYLGLVLVGATPQVLAQAATAKQFNVKDEIGPSEELDDDLVTSASTSLDRFIERTEQFLDELRDLGYPSRMSGQALDIQIGRTSFFPCIEGNSRTGTSNDTVVELGPDLAWKEIQRYSTSLIVAYDLSDCMPSSQFDGNQSVTTRHEFRLNSDGFTVELEWNKNSSGEARNLLRSLKAAFKEHDSENTSEVEMLLLSHTTFRASNDQVSLNLHLPRAALDPLLATDAK